jgi:hypothetical protein
MNKGKLLQLDKKKSKANIIILNGDKFEVSPLRLGTMQGLFPLVTANAIRNKEKTTWPNTKSCMSTTQSKG